jgi:formylglycine-generating enzyme required for sulfatase activity
VTSEPPRDTAFAKFQEKVKAWQALLQKPALPEDVQRCRIMAEDAFNNDKDFEKALSYYQKGLAIQPLWPDGQLNAALIAGELRQYDLAAFRIRCYLTLVPDAQNASGAREKQYLWEGKAQEEMLNLEMAYIQPGTFTMGSPASEKWRFVNQGPQTQVTLTKGYWLGKTEVTQGQWEALMGTTVAQQWDKANRNWTLVGESSGNPIYYVSWDEAMEFCRKLTERERQAGRLPDGYEYTLPTEAQWEYACRAGTTGDYAGNLDAMAWYAQNSGNTTHPVGQKQPNAWGLYDMQGNVAEWCLDRYKKKFPGGSVTDPTGPSSGSYRVTRGGGWDSDAARCRSATRGPYGPGDRCYDLGFRLALSSVR